VPTDLQILHPTLAAAKHLMGNADMLARSTPKAGFLPNG
jgi:hypothetical protein